MTAFKGFVGQSYNLRNVQYDAQRTLNWYPEVDESQLGAGGQPMQLVPTKGLKLIKANLPGPSRGGYVAGNGTCYWVFGGTLYKVSSSLGLTSVGSIGSGSTPVQMTDNGIDLFVISNGTPYAVGLTSNTITTLFGYAATTRDTPPVTIDPAVYSNLTSLTYYDTYIVFSKKNTNRLYWTDPVSRVIGSFNWATAEANPDNIVGIINNNQDLWVFGKKTTEIWYNYGANNFVFLRRPGILIETGCASINTAKKIGGTVAWLAVDDRSSPMVVIANGYTPTRVSTFPIEQAWSRLTPAQIEAATAYTYQDGGHEFYCLNIPGLSSTWVYDHTASKQLGQPTWHERATLDVNTGNLGRNLAEGHVYFAGYHLTGDYAAGNFYYFDEYTYTDNAAPIVRERTTPHVNNEMKRIFYKGLTLNFLVGHTTSQTLNPQVMLQHSDDGGVTWSNERWQSAGKIGEYGRKVEYFRLGSSKSRVFRIRCSDGQYWTIAGASIDLEPGAW